MTRPRYKAANHKDGRRRHRLLLLRLRLGKNNRWTDGQTDRLPDARAERPGKPRVAVNGLK